MSFRTRRQFLRTCVGAACAGGVLPHLLAAPAVAGDTSGYKALVCLFFFGGIDNNDVLIPRDNASYQSFADTRTELLSAYAANENAASRARDDLLALRPTNSGVFGGLEFGMTAEYEPVVDLFDSGELAVVGGVGPLVVPTTKQQFNDVSVPLPTQLFSHNDQQSAWQALENEGAVLGWGGRFMDELRAGDPSLRTDLAGMTTSGNTVFLSGATDPPYTLVRDGALSVKLVSSPNVLGSNEIFDETRARVAAWLESRHGASPNVFANDYQTLQAIGMTLSAEYGAAYGARTPLATPFGEEQLSQNLRAVAEAISMRNTLGVNRQVYFVGLGGFDTHDSQASDLPALHGQIARGIKSFRDAMLELGLWNDVTLFTAADFGRTMNDNGDGTDHGWGGHHIVAGGSVRGQQVYGSFPDSDPTSNDYTDERGRLIPTVSVEQYASTLGRWFGLTPAETRNALPNLANFNDEDLGFMRT